MPKPVKPNDTPTGRPVGVKTTQTSSSRAYQQHWEVQSDSDSDDDEEWPEDI
jgi:hypothetical protein